MHKDEMWQVYAPNGEVIPGEGWDSALGNPEETGSDKIVGVAVVFLFRVTQNRVELLWQKRSANVDRHPNDYDISAGGHINLGESLIDAAIRESYEEIGAKISKNDLYFVTMRPFNKNRFAWVYVADYTGRKEDFSFDDGEVSEVKWVPLEETDEFREKYAKKPLKKDKLTFKSLREWFKQHGYLQTE